MHTAEEVLRWLAAAAAGDQTEDPFGKLLALGPEDVDAIDPLCRALEDQRPSYRWIAARTLGQMHAPASAPALLRSMDGEDEVLRRYAALALGRIGERGADVLDRLRRALEDRDLLVRVSASGALLGLGEISPVARDVLASALRSEDVVTSYWAASALTEALPAAPAILPDVIAMLDHWNDAIVEDAGRALAERSPDEVIPPLLRALVVGSAEMKRGVIHALRDIGAAGRGATDAIADAMFEARVFEADAVRVRVWSMGLVEHVPLDRPDVKEATLRLLQDRDSWVCERAAHALLALPSATEEERERARATLDEA